MTRSLSGAVLGAATLMLAAQANAQSKPNILVVWGDDIGNTNISANTHGLMGYRTPNIDRIAREGMRFTDYYAEQSCTAGRAAFILGQSVFRSGLSKVGLPGAELGSHPDDPTIARVLKGRGYMTGQFGKNHFGDKDKHLPTMHGFDEFFGNLYHLNAEEEPENEDYPGDMVLPDGRTFREKFGPRGVIHSWANGDGTQRIEDTGPLTKKRMETVDDETSARAIEWIREQHAAGKPWFCWWNGTRMHFRTHVREEIRDKADKIAGRHLDEYQAGMVEHDMHIGKFLDLLDELGITDNTLVMYSTDNGVHMNTWPDGGMTPFRSEKNTNWEGAMRVPAFVRWPGHIKPGSVTNGIFHHMDWMPTMAAIAGETNLKEKLLTGYEADGKTYKVHLDGYNQLPLLTGKTDESPRKEVFYFTDDGDLSALRYGDWKLIFMEQKTEESLAIWMEPFVAKRIPLIINLRRDPYERGMKTSNSYYDWLIDRAWVMVPAQAYVGKFLETFKDYPPRMKAASFSLDQVMEKLQEGGGSK
ncbi:MAG: arylsulfatase [Phycisphaerales bacterium]|nr:MAG: arylsulfatase [Phycisphaerales bacterium]